MFLFLILVFVYNHSISVTFVSCSLARGAATGGFLSDTLGFEWAAACISFTGLFAVSCLTLFFIYSAASVVV